jgi:hypothetical protein
VPVSDYLPNLAALLNELTRSGRGVSDARELAQAADQAQNEQELDQALERVIAAWDES